MKHRSPLITLAAVALAFIIMFTVDVLAGPPGGNSAQPVTISVPHARASATNRSSQTTSTSTDTSAAVQLGPENPQVTVDGETRDAAPVNGDEEL